MRLIRDLIQSNRDKRAAVKSMQDFLQGTVNQWEIMSGRGHEPKLDKKSLIDKYKSWAYTCGNRNAAAIAKANLRLYSTRSTGEQKAGEKYGHPVGRPITKEQRKHLESKNWFNQSARVKTAAEVEEILEHPFIDLMQQVNPWHNQFDMMERTSLFQDMTGDAYWLLCDKVINGRKIPTDIWILPSQLVKIVPDPRHYIKGYLYGKNQSNPVKLRPEQVIHFKRPNLTDPWYGMSRIEGAWWAIVGYQSMEQYEFNQTENHGIQDLLINYKKGSLDAKQRRDLMQAWSQAMTFASGNRAPLIGDEDLEIKPVSWSPREMGFLKGREWRKGEIISAFGQHEAMYSKNANTANIKGAIYLWEEYETEPSLKRIEQKLNEQLLPRYSDRLFVAFDSSVEVDNEFLLKQVESDLGKNIRAINEVRAERGLDPVPWGDVPLVQSTIVPLGSTIPPGDETDQMRRLPEKGIKARSSFRSGSGSSGGTHTIEIKADGSVDIDLTGGANAGKLDKSGRVIEAGMREVWQAQFVLALQEVPRGSAADFSWVASEEWAQEIFKLTNEAIKEEIIVGGVRGAQKINVIMTDFIDRPRVQQAIHQHGFDFARAINQTTADRLKEAMSIGMEAGESIPELTTRIQSIHEGWSKWRAEGIARSESARALSAGQDLQWQESGVVAAKEWDAMDDACPFCLDMDGKIVELGNAWWTPDGANQTVDFKGKEITLKHEYLPVIGPPLHVSCRCDLKPVMIDV